MRNSTVGDPRPRATWTHDLLPSERLFLAAINELGHGHVERLRIQHGQLILDPWPETVQAVSLGSKDSLPHKRLQKEFELKPAVVQFFHYVRSIDEGEIVLLKVHRGLPTSMQVRYQPPVSQDRNG